MSGGDLAVILEHLILKTHIPGDHLSEVQHFTRVDDQGQRADDQYHSRHDRPSPPGHGETAGVAKVVGADRGSRHVPVTAPSSSGCPEKMPCLPPVAHHQLPGARFVKCPAFGAPIPECPSRAHGLVSSPPPGVPGAGYRQVRSNGQGQWQHTAMPLLFGTPREYPQDEGPRFLEAHGIGFVDPFDDCVESLAPEFFEVDLAADGLVFGSGKTLVRTYSKGVSRHDEKRHLFRGHA